MAAKRQLGKKPAGGAIAGGKAGAKVGKTPKEASTRQKIAEHNAAIKDLMKEMNRK